MRALVLLFLLSASAQAQDVQRALIQRDQQSDAFALQLRQSQEALKASPGNPARETRGLWERQRLDNLNEKQLIDPAPDRARMEAERRPFIYPIGETPR
jgi:hypothetical protein